MRARAATSTGSPARPARRRFPNDERLARRTGAPVLRRGGTRSAQPSSRACGPLRPYKWYVAAYRADRQRRALDQGDRRADRAQLARATAAASTAPATTAPIPRPRSRMQIAARHAGRLAGDAPMSRRADRAGAPRRRRRRRPRRDDVLPAPLVWTFDGPFASVPRRHRGHAAPRDRAGRRRVARRAADRSVAAGACSARRRGRRDPAGMGALPRPRVAALRLAVPAARAAPATTRAHWRRW